MSSKVADRPHRITIVLGSLSSLMALVALLVSLSSSRTAQESLKISQTSMDVAQRAYLAIEQGAVYFYVFPYDYKPGKTSQASTEQKFVIRNSGNTPAYISAIQRTYTLDSNDNRLGIEIVSVDPTKNGLPGSIAPKSEVTWLVSDEVTIRFPYAKELLESPFKPYPLSLRMRENFIYKDVFGNAHSSDLCWIMFSESHLEGTQVDSRMHYSPASNCEAGLNVYQRYK